MRKNKLTNFYIDILEGYVSKLHGYMKENSASDCKRIFGILLDMLSEWDKSDKKCMEYLTDTEYSAKLKFMGNFIEKFSHLKGENTIDDEIDYLVRKNIRDMLLSYKKNPYDENIIENIVKNMYDLGDVDVDSISRQNER